MKRTERKYALKRIATGDYLLPSNDAQIFWRISAYEDGPSHGLDGWPRDINLWRVMRYVGTGAFVDFEDSSVWREFEDGFKRRADAIEAALCTKSVT